MSVTLGSGSFKYEALEEWGSLHDDVRFIECPGVAVNSADEVYVLTRNTEYPVMVFDQSGRLLKSFGQGLFSERTHGIYIGDDDSVYCVDDGLHILMKFTSNGELLMTIGNRDKPSRRWSGEPFNHPTHVAVSRNTGNIFISDGYGNSRVHKFTPTGCLVKSWGEPGIDEGQFIWPHNLAIDNQDRIYVADRECHRIQIFDDSGNFITMWNNIHRPDGITIGPDGNLYIGELNAIPGPDDAPGLGHRVSIYNLCGELLARLGDPDEGDTPGKFIAPHSVAVDSRGDIYVGEVSFTIRGNYMNPPKEFKSLRKMCKIS